MLEVIYRIYEVVGKVPNLAVLKNPDLYTESISKLENIEVVMDCIICDTREQFKDIIRSNYGDDIKFRYSRKLPAGTLYCVIIGEHCYNTDRYFDKKEFECECCKSKVVTYRQLDYVITDYDLHHYLYGKEELFGKRFCCSQCKHQYMEYMRKHLNPDNDAEFYIDKAMFDNKDILGYIYKITKRNSGEFYVGQSSYLPVFRWGQHLKTERFPLAGIENYMFEVLEVVYNYSGDDLLEREKYWIRQSYAENPDKSLNVASVKG